uniref:hypothetical protein n=1 Tax=Candidatus Electronema sp. TaxID=2698783 RepID=UPI0040577E2C
MAGEKKRNSSLRFLGQKIFLLTKTPLLHTLPAKKFLAVMPTGYKTRGERLWHNTEGTP